MGNYNSVFIKILRLKTNIIHDLSTNELIISKIQKHISI